MRSLLAIGVAILAACEARSVTSPAALGDKVASFRLKDTSGREFTLPDSSRPVVLAFWSSGCPCSAACEAELSALARDFAGKAAVFAVASEDAPEVVRRVVREKGLAFPVLMDPEARVAERLGAEATPATVVIDASGVLRYRGNLESVAAKDGDVDLGGLTLRPVGEGEAKDAPEPEKWARNALVEVLAGRAVTMPSTPQSGCRIPRAPGR